MSTKKRFAILGALLVVAALFLLPLLFKYYTDGFSIKRSSREALIRDVLWETPKPLSGRINESMENYEPAFSLDGMTMVFTRGKARQNADLFLVHRRGQGWSDPEPLVAVNSGHDELGPELSRNGRYLYFYSNRPGGLGGYDLWVSRFDGQTWGAPENLGDRVNSEFNEYGPGLTPEGDRLFFSSNRLERPLTEEEKNAWKATLRENFLSSDYDVFASDVHVDDLPDLPAPLPGYGEATRLEILNSPADEGQVAMTSRGDFLYFSSNRDGGLGRFDLYRSRLLQGELMEPENMGTPVNSALDDMDPNLILEGHGLVFSSNRVERDGKRPFVIFKTVTREVISQHDYSALLTWLEKYLWPLLLLLLLLLALLFLLRYLLRQGNGLKASLLHRCLLLSLLVHLLLALLTSTWIVTYALYDMAGENTDDFALTTDALAEERIGLEIREQVTELASAEDEPLLHDAVDTLPLEAERLEQAPMTFEPIESTEVFDLPEVVHLDRNAELPELEPREAELDALAMEQKNLEQPTDLRPAPAPVLETIEDEQRVARQAEPRQDREIAAYAPTLPEPEASAASVVQTQPVTTSRSELLPSVAAAPLPRPPEPVETVMETPVKQEAREQSLASIAQPFEVEQVEDRHLPDEASMASPALAPRLIEENLQRFDRSALAEAEVDSLPIKSEKLSPASRPQSRSFDLPEPLQSVAMEVPVAAKAVREEQAPAPMTPPATVKSAPLQESPRPFTEKQSLLPEMDLTSSFHDSALAEAKPETVRHREDLPEVTHQALDRKVPLTTPTEMEKPAPRKAVESESQEWKASLSRIVKSKETATPATPVHALDLVDLEKPVDLPRSTAMKELEPVLPERLMDPIVPRVRRDLPLLPKKEPPAIQLAESTPRASRKDQKRLDPLSDPLPSAPIPMAFMPRHPKIDLPPPVPLEPEETPQSLLDLPPLQEREKARDLARYDHESLPTYHGLELRSKRVVFCLDVSNSMEWNNRIGEAKEELLRLLDALDESVEFNIITFSGRVRVWSRDGVLPAGSDNVSSAKRFVRRARIGSDGTNTLGALAAALADEDVESIYFLSDGHPTVGQTTNSEQILNRVQRFKQDRPVTIHTIAYIKGDPPPQWRNSVPPKSRLIDLMRRLAEQNSGNFVLFD